MLDCSESSSHRNRSPWRFWRSEYRNNQRQSDGVDYASSTIGWLRIKLSGHHDSDQSLDMRSSEMTLRVATLRVALIALFEEPDTANNFLLTPHDDLDGLRPVVAVFTTTGVAAVIEFVKTTRDAGLTGEL
jgi:hypothetical protein